jgi:ATP-dependent phosphofructokinase / diphosphate-dependent phosphofructokinase
MRLGLLTGGGDAPGLNAVIRAIVKSAAARGAECIGIEDGFAGLIDAAHWRQLTLSDLPGILRRGGTILGTANRRNPLKDPAPSGAIVDRGAQCIQTFHDLGLTALIVIGGDATLAIAHEVSRRGLPVVGVPKTIDNDIAGTAQTVGFDTAVSFATEAIDRLHTTAEAHHRIMVVEVMGRYAGWIALHSGIAGGADIILMPEIPYDVDKVAQRILARERSGARFSIVVAAEGARPVGGTLTVQEAGSAAVAERLGGVGARIAGELERLTQKEARSVLLGHLQRGGTPTSVDRLLATRFGARATELALDRHYGVMVGSRPPELIAVSLAEIAGRPRLVPLDSDLIHAAREIGIGFGD